MRPPWECCPPKRPHGGCGGRAGRCKPLQTFTTLTGSVWKTKMNKGSSELRCVSGGESGAWGVGIMFWPWLSPLQLLFCISVGMTFLYSELRKCEIPSSSGGADGPSFGDCFGGQDTPFYHVACGWEQFTLWRSGGCRPETCVKPLCGGRGGECTWEWECSIIQ